MSMKRRKAGLGFTSWQRSFSILAPWRKGKGDMVLDSEVVLTKMKIFQNFSEKLLVSEDSFSTSSDVSVCEQEVPEPTRTSEKNPPLNEEPNGSPPGEAGSDYLCAIFSDSKLPGLYKFESEDSGVELTSGANSPSTPTGSEQSFVVHSRESSCDSCRLNTLVPIPDEQVSLSEIGESEEKQTAGSPTDAQGDGDGDDDDDTLLKSTTTEEEELGFCIEQTNETLVEDPVEACCGDVLERSPDPVVRDVGSEPPAVFEEEEEVEEVRPSDQPSEELPVNGEFDDVFPPMTSSLRKSSTTDSLEEYMEECCRLSEVQRAGSNNPLGSGLGYLEHICQLIEKIGQLQETNLRLQKQICGLQKTSRVAKTREDFFQHHCSCGAAGLAYQEPPKRLQRNDHLSLSGTLSDLSTIHEVTRRPPLSEGTGRALGPVPLWRRGLTRRSYTEGESRFLGDTGAEGSPPVPQRRLSDNYTWGRVKDLVRKTKFRNSSSSRLGLSPTSLKMSCPQLYRPDLGPVQLPRNRNSMIALGHQNKLDLSWLQ
ncbi:unnamed protein product [Merluccius merluccius]